MQSLVRSTYRTLLKQSVKVDSDVAIRAMLCASPIQVYDRRSHEWVGFDGAKDWHDSRKIVDSLIRKLNGGREWYHPSEVELTEEARSRRCTQRRNPKDVISGALSSFIREVFRTNPCTTQNLNLAFAAVKSLNHTIGASKSLPTSTEDCGVGGAFPWHHKHFKCSTKVPKLSEEPGATLSLSGAHLLVSHPLMPGFFRHAVIILHRSDDEGAFGLMLNRPLTNQEGVVVPVWSALPDSHSLLSKHLANNPIMVGGPVTHTASMEPSIVFLHKFGSVKGAVPLTQEGHCDVFAGGDMDEMSKLFDSGLATPSDFVVVLGYCGWGHAQLDGEVERGSWFCTQFLGDVKQQEVPQGTSNETSSLKLSDFVFRASRLACDSGLRRVEDPKGTWCHVMNSLGGEFQEMVRLQSLSKLQFDDDDDES